MRTKNPMSFFPYKTNMLRTNQVVMTFYCIVVKNEIAIIMQSHYPDNRSASSDLCYQATSIYNNAASLLLIKKKVNSGFIILVQNTIGMRTVTTRN